MATASARLEVNDKGAIETITVAGEKFEQLSKTTDKADSEVRQLSDALSQASTSTEGLKQAEEGLVNENKQVSVSSENAANAVQSLSNSQFRQKNITEDQIQSLERLSSANRQASRSQQRFISSGSTTNEILFSTGDAIQDLQFGIRGAGNNIAFMAENFVQARNKAGSFSAVLSGVFSALKGPAGIIVGIQALLALGPSIVSFFQDSEQEAKDFSKALKDAASGLLEFENEIAGIQIENLEQAREMVSTLEDREERLNRLSRLRKR